MCPVCLAIGGLFAAVFFPRSRHRREREARKAGAWRLESAGVGSAPQEVG